MSSRARAVESFVRPEISLLEVNVKECQATQVLRRHSSSAAQRRLGEGNCREACLVKASACDTLLQ